jgi:hypothetical protein
LCNVSTLRCRTTKKGKFSEYFNETDIAIIREFNLDFIIRFAFGIIRGEILNVARYGIWSFHHGDEQRYRGAPPGFWEIYNGDAVSGAILQRLTDRLDAGVVLKKGFFKTVDYSLSRNLDAIYSDCARWPTQVCVDICNECATYLNNPPTETNAPVLHFPSNGQFLKFLGKILRNGLGAIRRFLFNHERWNIGLVYEPITVFLESAAKPKIHWLSQTKEKSKFLADPFGIQEGKELMILCEDFDYRTSRGIISRLQLLPGSPPRVAEAIIPVNHTSYPFLLKHLSKFYCIPESFQEREISLYEAETPLGKWTKVATLVKDFAGTDPTVFHHEGTWWLMCGNADYGDHHLYVWYAEHLFGPWKPHSGNPVKTDVRSARPAGIPFVHAGFLLRPAQDNSRTYGGRVVLNRVTRLTYKEYSEELVAAIEPDADGPFPDGLHTLSAVGNVTLVDGKRFAFIGSAFKHALAQLPRKVFVRYRTET